MDQQCRELTLRGHHLICTGLFQGAGYSDDFSVNMGNIVSCLQKDNPRINLVSDVDNVCQECPKADRCQDNENRCDLDSVKKKDRQLLDSLNLPRTNADNYSQILNVLLEEMTEEIFIQCCGDCSWYAKGFCDYQKYRENIMKLHMKV